MKTALLFGASGLVGSHILDQLLVDQYYGHIKVFARKPLQINNKKVELIITDFLDISTYSHAISGDDCFFSIGTTGKITPDRAEFTRIEFTIPIDIANFAKKNSIKCFASVFNKEGIDMLNKLKDDWVKIPSHEAYNLDLIELAFKKFQKVVISLGCLKKNELQKILNLIIKNRSYKKKAILLHCVSSYPLEPENCNFEKFDYLKTKFNNIGYSGHMQGINDALFALSKGASLIEKHFTINKNLPGRDNKFAILPNELAILSNYNKNLKKFGKKKGLGLLTCEKDIFKNYRGRWSKKIN